MIDIDKNKVKKMSSEIKKLVIKSVKIKKYKTLIL
jgi:hypothetical protein